MPNWKTVPESVVLAMIGAPPMLATEAIATTVLSHDDDCGCTMCTWWHEESSRTEDPR